MKRIINNNIYMLKFMWKYCKSNVILRLLSTLTSPVQPFIFIVSMKLTIDGIAEKRSLQYLVTVIGLAFLVGTVSTVFTSWVNTSSSAKAKIKISKGIQDELLKKAVTLDMSCFDDAEYYDKYVRAMQEAEQRSVEVLDSIVELLSGIIALIMILSLIISMNAFVIVICVTMIIINIFLNSVRNKILYKRDMEITRPEREAEYAKRIFYEPQYAQEIRLGKLGKLMNRKFMLAMDKTLDVIKKYCGKFVFFDSAFGIMGFCFMSVIMVFAAWQITIGNLSIGSFAALLNGAQQLLEKMFALFGQVPKISQNSKYIDNLRLIIESEPQISSEEKGIDVEKVENSISIKGLSFTYPGKNIPVLNNININIKNGQKTAIVGYNGVGKSTLVKLILRFYDPTTGNISIGETDYKKANLNSLRNKFGVVFQNYKCYAMSVYENVIMDDAIDESGENKTIEALKYSGIYEKITSFEKGIYTNLSREFDSEGVPLSGGEEQKIAISRAFVEDKDILILDEPSSALDPLAEYDINQKILSLAAEKTVIFISHRLSTVRMADMIYMMDSGEVVESGTHDELMKLDGKYAEMFRKQAENYVID
ncbi:MAG: ABC transporter ATP-binding protein/permease [Eubacterium sp.]|nr:ABC transporter ATP-binding protein/permease [Eubacterium sp.]